MKGTCRILLALLAIPISRSGFAQSGDAAIVTLLEPIRAAHHLPALGGAFVTSKGLVTSGVTGVRKKDAKPEATVDDLWHLGSDTKAMTATLIATLVERGLLRWETSIGDVFPDIAAKCPAQFRAITLTQLLSHHAGLNDNLNWRAMLDDKPIPEQRVRALETAAAMSLSSPPGTQFAYSSLGYVIAGTMAERVAHASWETLLQDVVFRPLGMSSCGFGGTGTPGRIDQPWPHGLEGIPMPSNGPLVDNPATMGPASTVHCSIADWAKYIAEQLRGANGQSTLLSASAYKVLHSAKFGDNYALGWYRCDSPGRNVCETFMPLTWLAGSRPWAGGPVLMHAGSNNRNYCIVWIAPARDFAVLAVTNQGGDDAKVGIDAAVAALIGMRTPQ